MRENGMHGAIGSGRCNRHERSAELSIGNLGIGYVGARIGFALAPARPPHPAFGNFLPGREKESRDSSRVLQ